MVAIDFASQERSYYDLSETNAAHTHYVVYHDLRIIIL